MKGKLTFTLFNILYIGCFLGNSHAQLSIQVLESEVIDFDKTLAEAKQGDAESQYKIAKELYIQKKFDDACKWTRKSAEQGYPFGQHFLGNAYYYGKGVAKNFVEAVKWYRKAAEQGNPDGQNQLGNAYYYGEGVAKDYVEAVKWYRKAAEQGYNFSLHSLGSAYYHGEGVAKDYVEAVKWYREAAEQGDDYSQYDLGNAYYYGKGVLKDYKEAVKWYRLAADQGHADAQFKLGLINDNGTGEAKKEAVQEDETKNESAITLGENFTVPDLNLDMIWVYPGTFTMGSPENASEIQHQVTLTKGFYLGKYEVTQAQWKQVMGDNPSVFKGADRPVEKVSWNDAVEFCDKLTEMENKGGRVPQGMFYRLPTESQWEYACRAGTSTKYSWGDDIDPKLANYRDSGLKETVPVGSYRPNAWGFYDMPGNVWEWTADWGGIYPSGPVTDPIGPASGHHGADSRRVTRGGSWGSLDVRSAGRGSSHPRNRLHSLGFRVSFQTSESVKKFSGQSNANLSKNIEIKAQHIIENKVDIVLTNLKAGANPNIVFNKNTALHFACSLGKFEIVELLLKFGAKPNPSNGRYTPMDLLFNKDWKGKTAEEKMSSKVREKILNLLKKNGGKQMQDIQLSK